MRFCQAVAVPAVSITAFGFFLLLAACTQPSSSTGGGAPGSASTDERLGTNDMFARLPDRETAECLGRLEFTSARSAFGQSTCGNQFTGTTDQPMPEGLVCVYSATPTTRTAAQIIATGHFACADSSRGDVRFVETGGRASGTAIVTSEDGRIVTFSYEN